MTKKEKNKEFANEDVQESHDGHVTFAARIGSGSEIVFPEDHPSSPAFSMSSKPPSFLSRVSYDDKENYFDNEDVTSNIFPVVDLPPPPGIEKLYSRLAEVLGVITLVKTILLFCVTFYYIFCNITFQMEAGDG